MQVRRSRAEPFRFDRLLVLAKGRICYFGAMLGNDVRSIDSDRCRTSMDR